MKGQRPRKIVAIDLFCGAGGLTNGLRTAGIEVAAGIDLDPICRFAFEHNNPSSIFILKDISAITPNDLMSLWAGADARLLAGCAPCQPFSTYSQGKDHSVDSRWTLLSEFGRLAVETLPDFVTMENVPSLQKTTVFESFVRHLRVNGYSVWSECIDCSAIGVAQTRRRLVLIASRVGDAPAIEQRLGSKAPTVGALLKGLKKLDAGSEDSEDALHRCASLSPLNLRRIRASKPGGNWHDWPASLRAKCHTRKSGDGYWAIYGRMEWDRPAPTITTQCYNFGSGRFGHPEQDRPISLREAALLQGFPRNYQFESRNARLGKKSIARIIGNAVPPPLGRKIAEVLIRNTRR